MRSRSVIGRAVMWPEEEAWLASYWKPFLAANTTKQNITQVGNGCWCVAEILVNGQPTPDSVMCEVIVCFSECGDGSTK